MVKEMDTNDELAKEMYSRIVAQDDGVQSSAVREAIKILVEKGVIFEPVMKKTSKGFFNTIWKGETPEEELVRQALEYVEKVTKQSYENRIERGQRILNEVFKEKELLRRELEAMRKQVEKHQAKIESMVMGRKGVGLFKKRIKYK